MINHGNFCKHDMCSAWAAAAALWKKHHFRHSHTIFIFTMLATSESIVCCCDNKIWLTQNGGSIEATAYLVSWLFIASLSWCSLPATQDLAAESPIPEQILEENLPQQVQPWPQASPCRVASLFLTPLPLTPCCCHSPNTLPSSLEAKQVESMLLEVFHYFSGHTCQTCL